MFSAQFLQQGSDALCGLFTADVVVLFQFAADFVDAASTFQPLPDEAAGFVEGVVVLRAHVQQYGFVVELGGDNIRVRGGAAGSAEPGVLGVVGCGADVGDDSRTFDCSALAAGQAG